MASVQVIVQHPIIELSLAEKEARILRAMIQNPLTKDEPEDEYKVRSAIFNTLTIAISECKKYEGGSNGPKI